MDIAIYIFEKLTALDAIGPYEVLQRLPGANVKFVGPERGPVRTDQGMLGVVVDYERDEVGCTPASYVERVRVEVARRLLETTGLGAADVARAAGFGTPETMRRAFARRVGTSPIEYRDRFRPQRAS